MKRLFDLVVTATGLLILGLPMLLIALCVRVTSEGPILYWSERVGRYNRIFLMPKFRTMRVDTPVVATHLLADPESHLTSIGGFLRKTSLDELPQLWCILKGEMSIVGPRPALFNQHDLIEARTACNVHSLPPGLTGWAQINGRDELTVDEKVRLDEEYLRKRSFLFDLKVVLMTALRITNTSNISH